MATYTAVQQSVKMAQLGRGYDDHHKGDTPAGMTRARRLARYLSKYKWYFPASDLNGHDENGQLIPPPKLDSGWAHFEHIALPRCFKHLDDNGNFHRAEPGESVNETMLYPVWKTKLIDMGDFGRGVGLYFTNLQQLAIITFIAGLINIPALIHLNSDEYSPDGREDIADLLQRFLLKLSAVCTATTWEPCPTCTVSDWDRFSFKAKDRYAEGKASDGSMLSFIKVNNCEMDNLYWISTYSSMIFVALAIYVIYYLQKKKAIKLDEAVQTTTDYSIEITNPAETANDPVSWKDFFEDNFEAKVDVVTVAIDNEALIKALIARRVLLTNLEDRLPLGTKFDIDDLDKMGEHSCSVSIWKKLICCAKTSERIVADIHAKEEEIVELTKKEFGVSRVFVTFDTEASQRNVLKDLYVAESKLDTVPHSKRYEGKVLKVLEPDEPISIRWTDLSDTFKHQLILQLFTAFLSLCVISAAGFSIAFATYSESVSPLAVSIIIMIMNTLIPIIVRYITSFESHNYESSLTASQYYKITAFRWLVTVVIPLISIPFADILNKNTIIEYVETQFIVEIMQRPILQIFNLIGILNRHILGPRAIDQRRMNLKFNGDYYTLGERYTNVTKILFLTVFYSMLYPLGFFFASVTFIVYYWADKFCILRSWTQAPMIGTKISTLSMFFFQICVLAYAIMAAYMGSQIPYDDACVSEDEDLSKYTVGPIEVTLPLKDEEENTTITTVDQAYKFCNQELIRSGHFPPLPNLQDGGGIWMDEKQETFSNIFGWTAVAVLTVVLVSLLRWCYKFSIYPLFFKSYQPHGEDQNQAFNDVTEIAAYIPQVKVPGFSFPFLICDDRYINRDHVGWTNPKVEEEGYDYHNLIFDVKEILERKEAEQKNEIDNTIDRIFSTARGFVNGDGVRLSARVN